MLLTDFDYNLPSELIAQKPCSPRDHSRLFVINRKTKKFQHKNFYQLDKFLKKGDVLVINNSQVFPARLIGHKTSGGKIEVFLHQVKEDNIWECLVRGKVKTGLKISFNNKLTAELLSDQGDGTWLVSFNLKAKEFWHQLEKIGQIPLPPYIQPDIKSKNRRRYQTVYADSKQRGSVAAPTAGLHFTERLLQKLSRQGVKIVPLTLHVGLGTFASVKTQDIRKHQMHEESFFLSLSSLETILKAKKLGNRVIAVGTTSCRVLESLGQDLATLKFNGIGPYFGSTKIFLYPGKKFLMVDALITNFHLPKSTLLMLVSAFAGTELIKKAYQEAIKEAYRFYSYGDAMLIL
ncbi:MAG: tRNA preQ1(34) S-adenosylmethionine ribosyltransferase-isomerase QueA [Patescibacteria group bacterium]|jgi:S-adenosylmethionine:tRNA ribosyltransferase-isomerase|nr:tRNA preQ1(34) S-adenosylmethionine ribosyltransferase-isomerase QueA [Patescibacteria group bacterium]